MPVVRQTGDESSTLAELTLKWLNGKFSTGESFSLKVFRSLTKSFDFYQNLERQSVSLVETCSINTTPTDIAGGTDAVISALIVLKNLNPSEGLTCIHVAEIQEIVDHLADGAMVELKEHQRLPPGTQVGLPDVIQWMTDKSLVFRNQIVGEMSGDLITPESRSNLIQLLDEKFGVNSGISKSKLSSKLSTSLDSQK